MENWEMLKSKLYEQLTDIDKHRGSSGNWNICRRTYNQVLDLMTAIEEKRHEKLMPFNGVWHTKGEIQELLNDNE